MAGRPDSGQRLRARQLPDLAALDTAREEFEGELFQPVRPLHRDRRLRRFGVHRRHRRELFFGEIGLAANTTVPLVAQTEVIDAARGRWTERIAYNNAHRLVLDDGSSTT